MTDEDDRIPFLGHTTQDGEKVVSRALEFGSVSSVIRGATSTDLQVGALGIFKMSDVKQIL